MTLPRLESLFLTAVESALPCKCLAGHWPVIKEGRLSVLAVGKAAAAMAEAAQKQYGNHLEGLVLVPDGHRNRLQLQSGLRLIESGHPVPDERSVQAANAALELATGMNPDDLLLVLLSGGGSSV
jgi:hydroxypyruvate reductase